MLHGRARRARVRGLSGLRPARMLGIGQGWVGARPLPGYATSRRSRARSDTRVEGIVCGVAAQSRASRPSRRSGSGQRGGQSCSAQWRQGRTRSPRGFSVVGGPRDPQLQGPVVGQDTHTQSLHRSAAGTLRNAGTVAGSLGFACVSDFASFEVHPLSSPPLMPCRLPHKHKVPRAEFFLEAANLDA